MGVAASGSLGRLPLCHWIFSWLAVLAPDYDWGKVRGLLQNAQLRPMPTTVPLVTQTNMSPSKSLDEQDFSQPTVVKGLR
jgi:hypothetical protein